MNLSGFCPACGQETETLGDGGRETEGTNRASSRSLMLLRVYEYEHMLRNMLPSHRRASERAKKLGVANVLWEFFKTMHEVQGKTSKGLSSRHSQQEVYPPQDVLQLYVEMQERKMNMWSQQKALEERTTWTRPSPTWLRRTAHWCRKMDRKLKWIWTPLYQLLTIKYQQPMHNPL